MDKDSALNVTQLKRLLAPEPQAKMNARMWSAQKVSVTTVASVWLSTTGLSASALLASLVPDVRLMSMNVPAILA